MQQIWRAFKLKYSYTSPTHVLQNSSPSIDLTFTNQHNFVIDSKVHTSLHSNFHQQIIYSKMNLKVVYPSPYERLL